AFRRLPAANTTTGGGSPPGLRVFAAIGGFVVAKFAFQLLKYTRRHFLPGMHTLGRPDDFLESRYGSGSWVVLVGATSTLGCAFGHQFAKRNFNMVLIDDDAKRLEAMAKEYQRSYPTIMIKMIVTNFETAAMAGWTESIVKELRNMAISVLINAVQGTITMTTTTGVDDDTSTATAATACEEEFIRKSLVVNTFPSILMTERILPRLAHRFEKINVRGAIITISPAIEDAEVGKDRR
ncbi:MAG: hypothetical protein SGARI_002061, partial [Bacillariaceae sp.]